MDISFGPVCNNRCLMCTNPDPPWPAWPDGTCDYSTETIKNRLRKQADKIRAGDSLYLAGGEPTIHPGFLEIMEFAKQEFPDQTVKLLSNGRLFCYEQFTKKTLATNDRLEIDLSLHGPDAETHDRITQAGGSFVQASAGLKNLLNNKSEYQVIGVRCVLTRLSYDRLPDLFAFMSSHFNQIDRLVVIFPEIEAQAEKNAETVGVDYPMVRPYVEACFKYLADFHEVRFYHFPLCTLAKRFWPHIWRTLPEDEVVFYPRCERCAVKEYCLGVPDTYQEYINPKQELQAITEKPNLTLSGNYYRPISGVN